LKVRILYSCMGILYFLHITPKKLTVVGAIFIFLANYDVTFLMHCKNFDSLKRFFVKGPLVASMMLSVKWMVPLTISQNSLSMSNLRYN
jgi:hypothetical protein